MTYKAVSGDDGAFYITYADGPQIGTRVSLTPYKNKDSAQRRIRELVKRENIMAHAVIEAPRVVVPTVPAFAGVYPAVPKRAYRHRRAYA